MLSGVTSAIGFDYTSARQPSMAAYQCDAVLRQPLLLTGVGVVGHHVIAPRERGRDINFRLRRCCVRCVRCFAGAQQSLGWNAGPVGALAADELALDDGDAQTAFGQCGRAMLARRATADDDDVEVVA